MPPKKNKSKKGTRSLMGPAQKKYIKNQLKTEKIDTSRKNLRQYLNQLIIYHANEYLKLFPDDKSAKEVIELKKSTYYDYLKILKQPTANKMKRAAKKKPNIIRKPEKKVQFETSFLQNTIEPSSNSKSQIITFPPSNQTDHYNAIDHIDQPDNSILSGNEESRETQVLISYLDRNVENLNEMMSSEFICKAGFETNNFEDFLPLESGNIFSNLGLLNLE